MRSVLKLKGLDGEQVNDHDRWALGLQGVGVQCSSEVNNGRHISISRLSDLRFSYVVDVQSGGRVESYKLGYVYRIRLIYWSISGKPAAPNLKVTTNLNYFNSDMRNYPALKVKVVNPK